MGDLYKSLNIILEDNHGAGLDSLNLATNLVQRLQEARQLVSDLQYQLGNVKLKLAAELAIAIRRAKPGLNVGVNKDGCRVGYKTKAFHLTPDLEQGVWTIESKSHRFCREFIQANRRAVLLDQDLSIIVSAIVNYFSNYYRTLGEDIDGTGILILNEKKSTILEVADWMLSSNTPPLKSRLSRRGALLSC